MTTMDDHGQPMALEFNFKRNRKRDVEHLLGLAEGVLADGHLPDEEIEAIHRWLEINYSTSRGWPANVIHDRIHAALADSVIDEEERADLFGLLRKMNGPDFPGAIASTELPCSELSEPISISGYSFCLTGEFAFGPRRIVQKEIEALGGFIHDNINRSTDVLVVGSVGSRDWKHSAYGNKIEKAVEYREKRGRIVIVGEDRWIEAVDAARGPKC